MDAGLKRLTDRGLSLHELLWDEELIHAIMNDMARGGKLSERFDICFMLFVREWCDLYGSPAIPDMETVHMLLTIAHIPYWEYEGAPTGFLDSLSRLEGVNALGVKDSTTAMFQNAFVYAIACSYCNQIMAGIHIPLSSWRGGVSSVLMDAETDQRKYLLKKPLKGEAYYARYVLREHPLLAEYVETRQKSHRRILAAIGYLLTSWMEGRDVVSVDKAKGRAYEFDVKYAELLASAAKTGKYLGMAGLIFLPFVLFGWSDPWAWFFSAAVALSVTGMVAMDKSKANHVPHTEGGSSRSELTGTDKYSASLNAGLSANEMRIYRWAADFVSTPEYGDYLRRGISQSVSGIEKAMKKGADAARSELGPLPYSWSEVREVLEKAIEFAHGADSNEMVDSLRGLLLSFESVYGRKDKVLPEKNEATKSSWLEWFIHVVSCLAGFALVRYFGAVAFIVLGGPAWVGVSLAKRHVAKGWWNDTVVNFIVWSNIITWLLPPAGLMTGFVSCLVLSGHVAGNRKRLVNVLGWGGVAFSLINAFLGYYLNPI